MSLKATVAAGVEQAFTASGDLVSDGTYTVRTGSPVYDPVADTYVATTNTYQNVRMIRASISNEEREASTVAVSDVKVLIPAIDLGNTKPSETDTFELDGLGYNVLTHKGVPGDSLWIIYAREK